MITQAIQDMALETGSDPNGLRTSCICLNWNHLDLPLSQLARKQVPPYFELDNSHLTFIQNCTLLLIKNTSNILHTNRSVPKAMAHL